MVDDDDRQADGFGLIERINSRAAAVDCDDEVRTGILQVLERGRRWSIALFQTVWHVEAEVLPPGTEIAREDGRGRAAINVIVGKDGDTFPGEDGIEDDACGLVHVGKAGRVGEIVPQRGGEIARRLRRIDIARGQQAGKQVRAADTWREAAYERLVGVSQRPEAA